MLSLKLTPMLAFEPRFRMFIINGYDRKTKLLYSLDFLLFLYRPYPEFRYSKLVFLILKISQYGGSRW